MTSTYSSLITCTQSQSVDADLRFDCEILCENRNSPLRFTTLALETSLRKFRGNTNVIWRQLFLVDYVCLHLMTSSLVPIVI